MNGNNVHTGMRPNSYPSSSTGKVTNSIPPPLTGEGKGGGDASCRWDSLIQQSVQNLWPETDWRLIKCQMRQESAFSPRAVSPCGAIGLLQIMPATGESLGLTKNMLFIPEENVKAGIIYLKRQYDRFPEIPDYHERLKFALASYNGGRGYINQAAGRKTPPGRPGKASNPILPRRIASSAASIPITGRSSPMWPGSGRITAASPILRPPLLFQRRRESSPCKTRYIPRSSRGMTEKRLSFPPPPARL